MNKTYKLDWNAAFTPPFYVEPEESDTTLTISLGPSNVFAFEYSSDGSNWTSYTEPVSISQKTFIRADSSMNYANIGKSSSTTNFHISLNKDYSIGGNLNYLMDYRGRYKESGNSVNEYRYAGIFKDETNLKSISDLYSSARHKAGYRGFNATFQGCTGLVDLSSLILSFDVVGAECYFQMFAGCTGLTKAPQLPRSSLFTGCYREMFSGCTSLTVPPALSATTLVYACYKSMFSGCTSLVTPPALPATTLATECYYRMFASCTSLTSAPALPATTLPDAYSSSYGGGCYREMFYGCTALTTPPALPATDISNSDSCYAGMFQNCVNLLTAPALPSTALSRHCYRDMFNGCRNLEKVPDLQAATLKNYCYSSMFSGCQKLKFSTTQTGEYQNSIYIGAGNRDYLQNMI